MSYTTKGMPAGTPVFETNLIHEAMISQLVSINAYVNHITNSNVEEINSVLEHMMQDEKCQYAMLLDILRKYDTTQMYMYDEVKERVKIEAKPFQVLYAPQYSSNLILNNIRDCIKKELEAILLYENHVVQITTKEIKELFVDIIANKKGHVEELTHVLLKYDSFC